MFARSADELAGLHGIEKKRKVQEPQVPGKGFYSNPTNYRE